MFVIWYFRELEVNYVMMRLFLEEDFKKRRYIKVYF